MYNVNVDEGVVPSINVFQPSFGEALGASVGSTFNENPTTLGYDAVKTSLANRGEKLPREESEAAIKSAGIKLKIPEDGYTREALDIMVKRKQDQNARQSVMDRTPWGWIGSPVRGTAQLLTGVVDPLNVASAFIPVVGEARVASMLARQGLARAGARAQIGAAEGFVGAAVLEPAVYGLHSQLQDDYKMTDSLINLGFGSLLGAGLHVTGGAGADVFRASDPYARFTGLDAQQVRGVLDFEKATRDGLTPDPAALSQTQRRAAGLEPAAAWKIVDEASPEGREVAMRAAVADMSNGRMPDVTAIAAFDREANFKAWFGKSAIKEADGAPRVMYHGTAQDVDSFKAKTAGAIFLTDEPIFAQAYADQSAKWMAVNGKEGAPNILPVYVKADRPFDYENPEHVQAVLDRYTPPEKPTGWESTGDGAHATRESLSSGVWTAIEHADVQDAIKAAGFDSFYVDENGFKNLGVYDPAQLKSAIGNSGKFDPKSTSITDQVASTAKRQQEAESVALGSPEASKAADARIAEAPKENAVETAEAELADAMTRLKDIERSLELAGASPEKVAKLTEALKTFDEAITDAVNIGKALVQNALCGVRQ